jgi:hypothetical protein
MMLVGADQGRYRAKFDEFHGYAAPARRQASATVWVGWAGRR